MKTHSSEKYKSWVSDLSTNLKTIGFEADRVFSELDEFIKDQKDFFKKTFENKPVKFEHLDFDGDSMKSVHQKIIDRY